MIALVVALVVAQPVTTTRVGSKVGQDTYCLNCSGGTGGGGGASGPVVQGTAADGGLDWATRSKVWDGTDTLDVTAAGAAKVDGSAVTQPVSAAALPLPAGAATEATLATLLTSGTFTARLNTLGQKTMANSAPVVLASDQSAIPVTGPLTDAQLRASPVPVSGTVTANAGTGPWPVTDNGGSLTVDGTVAATQSGTWTVQPGNTPNTAPWLTTDTPRQVASAVNPGTCVSVTASTTVLASNASRRAYGFKASEANTDRVHCKLGATATTSNTIFGPGAGWSQDTGAVYTGVVDCIAASGTQSVCPYEVN